MAIRAASLGAELDGGPSTQRQAARWALGEVYACAATGRSWGWYVVKRFNLAGHARYLLYARALDLRRCIGRPYEGEPDTWEEVCRALGGFAGEWPPTSMPPEEGGNNMPATSPLLGGAPDVHDLLRKIPQPSESCLDRWTRHRVANDFLREFTLQHRLDDSWASMTCREVVNVVEALGLTASVFVEKFRARLGLSGPLWGSSDADRTALRIVGLFAKRPAELGSSPTTTAGKGIMFREVYRLLEIIGFSLRRFMVRLSSGELNDYYDPREHESYLHGMPTLSGYRIRSVLGAGLGGAIVYLAEHTLHRTRVAVKWPLPSNELRAIETVARRVPPGSPGCLPRVLASGTHDHEPYVVTELLGSHLAFLFLRLQVHSLRQRWRAVRVLGRMVLRRLKIIHDCGYLHCDVSPYNMLLGRSYRSGWNGESGKVETAMEVAPYLIDLGQARVHPGTEAQRGDLPSLEFSSIRSGDGGVPLPADDLEALGWTMVYGLFGDLPWIAWLAEYSELSEDQQETRRNEIIHRVQQAKQRLLDWGWGSLGREWAGGREKVPPELDEFIRICNASHDAPELQPDYARLARVLGARQGLDVSEAEAEDARQYSACVTPLL